MLDSFVQWKGKWTSSLIVPSYRTWFRIMWYKSCLSLDSLCNWKEKMNFASDFMLSRSFQIVIHFSLQYILSWWSWHHHTNIDSLQHALWNHVIKVKLSSVTFSPRNIFSLIVGESHANFSDKKINGMLNGVMHIEKRNYGQSQLNTSK